MADNNDLFTRDDLQLVLLNSIKRHVDKPAFFFGEASFSYHQLFERVSQLQNLFLDSQYSLPLIGVITNNDFDTYSAIVTCLLSGITYIPIEPSHPDERNNYIIELSGLDFIYCSNNTTLSESFHRQNHLKFLSGPERADVIKEPFLVKNTTHAYILFTSGTTGVPKGVPITIKNLEAFANNIDIIGVKITAEDRFLQVIDLTFDLSIISWLIPLLHGASIYTLPNGRLKYMPAVQLIEEKDITHITAVPSFISYLEPYFKEISLPTVKYWLFSGEALKTRYVEGWQKCVPAARIFNVYGPTEATVFCSSYYCKQNPLKEHKGIVCIGKPFEGTSFKLFNEGKCVTENGVSGELCIAGMQLTKGYLNQDVKNKEAFFEYEGFIYYRTGDICVTDSNGDYFFEGRNDSQVKIDGYRIELGEIENIALTIKGIRNAVALAVDGPASVQIILFLVGEIAPGEVTIRDYLKKRIPAYMIPGKIIFIGDVPLNLNGKIDRKSLLAMYKQNI